jgi:hypothetical protein
MESAAGRPWRRVGYRRKSSAAQAGDPSICRGVSVGAGPVADEGNFRFSASRGGVMLCGDE